MNAWTAQLPHLLRPLWLLALFALPMLWWLWRRRAHNDTPWKRAVDPHLLPSLLQEAKASRGTGSARLFAACYTLAVLALAGPALRQPVATFAPQAPLVIVQDMSSHMLVADLAPSRLLRARLKVQQLIASRKGGQIGLVAYAGDAFTVTPVSDDAHSLDDLVVALAPDTMPVDGQRADRGLHRAADLLSQAGFPHGTILLLSDTADADAEQAAREARAKGYDVDTLGLGTAVGAPLPAADGTFAQDDKGTMRIARLDADALRKLADAGGGRYAELTTSTADLAALDVLDATSISSATRASADAIAWRDGGPFLLLALLPMVAFGFRRGWLAVVFVALLTMPAHRVEATETPAQAQARVTSQRAGAAYRKGDYLAAANMWSALNDADSHYNRGNALAQMECFPQAIDAWQRALRLHPDMKDASANIGIVRPLSQHQTSQPKQCGELTPPPQDDGQQQDERQASGKQDRQGQSRNREKMQRSQQQAQQQGGPQNRQQQAQQSSSQQQQQQHQNASQQQDASRPAAPDPKQQAQADAAEKQALQKALLARKQNANGKQREALGMKETTAQREQREANEALLQRVEDDPGSLLRRKFALEFARRQQEGDR